MHLKPPPAAMKAAQQSPESHLTNIKWISSSLECYTSTSAQKELLPAANVSRLHGRGQGRRGEYRGNDNEDYFDRGWDTAATKGGHGCLTENKQNSKTGMLLSGSHLESTIKKERKGATLGFLRRKIQLFTKDRSYVNLARIEVRGV